MQVIWSRKKRWQFYIQIDEKNHEGIKAVSSELKDAISRDVDETLGQRRLRCSKSTFHHQVYFVIQSWHVEDE